jgi:GT2 family glycosyltransferase
MIPPASPLAPIQGTALQASYPTISVIIPTYNRVSRLRQVIAALEKQQYPPEAFEVIIVSDGSSDGTDAFLEAHRSLIRWRWLSQKNLGPAAARNAGVNVATGEFIVFIDDDVVPEVGLLAEHMRAHDEANREVAALGPLLTPQGFSMAPWVRWEQEMLMKQYDMLLRGDWQPSWRQFYTGNASVKRTHILAAGGFNESFRRAEDVDLACRLAAQGLDFVFTMRAAGQHYAERSYRSWLDAAYAYGRNDAIFTRDPNRDWLLSEVQREFRGRNSGTRMLVRACAGRPLLTSLVASVLKLSADAATLVHGDRIETAVYSALFNLRYYSGLLDELGAERLLFQDYSV